jgi:hypothetical protein
MPARLLRHYLSLACFAPLAMRGYAVPAASRFVIRNWLRAATR